MIFVKKLKIKLEKCFKLKKKKVYLILEMISLNKKIFDCKELFFYFDG